MYISPRIVPRFKKIQTLLNQLHPQADPQALVAPGSTPPQGDIIVLPGSFNPPTIAHLALLKQAQRFGQGQAQSLRDEGNGQGQAQSLRELLERPENRRFARFVHALPFDPLYRDVSSTLVRRGGAAYGRDVPQEVRQFMKKTRAYAPPVRSADGSMVDVYAARVAALSQLLHGPVS